MLVGTCSSYCDDYQTGAPLRLIEQMVGTPADQLALLDPVESWDPLDETNSDPGLLIAAQRREIINILRSYTGYYDLFSELLQNALDAVDRRAHEGNDDYKPSIWIKIDLKTGAVTVTDNGCGMDAQRFRQFLRPNFSFKERGTARGSKGVGATYLGYGFNHLEVATKADGRALAGALRQGRAWVEDSTDTIPRPRFEASAPQHPPFATIDRGASMTVRLVGKDIRPKHLGWIGATTADTWLPVLRATTPLGGIYLCSKDVPAVQIEVEVIDAAGISTTASLAQPRYLYPHEFINNSVDLREFLRDQKRRVSKGLDVTQIPPKYRGLSGLWGEWSGDEILDGDSDCPISPRLDESEQKLMRELGIQLYICLAFSTDLWDTYNDRQLGLRSGHRLIRGGLQLATRHMPQGSPLTIPMTNNIGFQNLAHVVIHMDNAEPDLGRKGFQPDQARLAEKLAVSAVTAFRKRYGMLRKPGGAKEYDDELKLTQWIRAQEDHEEKNPLVIRGKGLFMPTEELPIRSVPVVEQDVVALFNQMLSAGLVRGIQLISSSQYKQYDGLYRVTMVPPLDRYIRSDSNPLGLDADTFAEREQLATIVKVLEYKYSLDGLVEEIQAGVKAVEDIGLVVAWSIGERWKQMFDLNSYLDEDNVHHRRIHGTTHSFTHSMSGARAFEAIILEDLVNYLHDPEAEQQRQRQLYSGDRDPI